MPGHLYGNASHDMIIIISTWWLQYHVKYELRFSMITGYISPQRSKTSWTKFLHEVTHISAEEVPSRKRLKVPAHRSSPEKRASSAVVQLFASQSISSRESTIISALNATDLATISSRWSNYCSILVAEVVTESWAIRGAISSFFKCRRLPMTKTTSV